MRTQPLSFPVGGDARVSSAARDLLSAMLMKDPGARPTLQTIAKDAWVTSMGDMPTRQITCRHRTASCDTRGGASRNLSSLARSGSCNE